MSFPPEQFPPGVHCDDLSVPQGIGPHWQQWVNPTNCKPWESVLVHRAQSVTYPPNKAQFNEALAGAGLCCEAQRAWAVSQEALDQDWSTECQDFNAYIDGHGAQWAPHLHRLLVSGDQWWDEMRHAHKHKQWLYIETWKDTPEGIQAKFFACRPDAVNRLRALFKKWRTLDKGAHPGRYDFPEPDKSQAAELVSDIKGPAARRRQRETQAREDAAVLESTQRKKDTALATLAPGECVAFLDEIICGPEVITDTPEPVPAARFPLALVLGIGGALIGGPPGALGGAALGAWIQKGTT